MTLPARRAYFVRAAEDEFLATRRYYAGKSQDLAEAFHAEVLRAVAFIERFPEASPRSIGDLRKKVLRTPFEYSLFYEIEPDRIRITAVAHHRQAWGYFLTRQ